MSTHIPGGEVTMHPGPKVKTQGTKLEHGSHDVKMGHGGNDVIIQGGPKTGAKGVLGQHNTEVQDQPGNTVQMSSHSETRVLSHGETNDLLSGLGAHTRDEMEVIAKQMELSFSSDIEDGELVKLIYDEILERQ